MKKIIQRMSSLFLVICLVVSLLQSLVNAEDLQEEVVDETPVSEGAYGEHYYEVIDKSMTWTSAKEYCENLGGHLVTITSAEEQAFIETLVCQGAKKQYWIGAYLDGDNYKWVTGEEFAYANWDASEPNQKVNNGVTESYVHLYNESNPVLGSSSKRYAWNDMYNDNIYPGEEDFFTTENVGIIVEYETYDSEKTSNSSVCYFKEWDAENQIAYFGQNDLLGSQVTEETDTSFFENIDELVGEYVLVETKSREDDLVAPDTLISIKSVETKIGTVSSADANEIVIDGVSYATPKDANLYGINENDLILYHLYENELVGINFLESRIGKLTFWSSDTRKIVIDPDGRSEGATEYVLSTLVDEETMSYLGMTGHRSSSVTYMIDGVNIIYSIEQYLPPESPNYYEIPAYDSEQEEILASYAEEWLKAYENFVSVMLDMLEEVSISEDAVRESSIAAEADRMKKADNQNDSKYINFIDFKDEQYKKEAYLALATLLYNETSSGFDFSSVNLSSSSAGTTLVKSVMNSLYETTYEHDCEKVEIRIEILKAGESEFGKLTCTEKNTHKTYSAIICATQTACEETIYAYSEELKDLATNATYNIYNAIATDILKQPLSKLSNDYIEKQMKILEKKAVGKLEEKLKISGVGNMFNNLNECYDYYDWLVKCIQVGDVNNLENLLEKVGNLKFEDTSINKWTLKWAMDGLNKACSKLNDACVEYLNGTLEKSDIAIWLKAKFNCPVNVAVFNSNEEQIGYIGNDNVWYTDDIEISEDSGAKTISLLVNDTLSFEIMATDYGIMSCSFEEYSGNDIPLGRLNYYNLSLTPDQKYDLKLSEDLSSETENLAIMTGEESILPDEYISSDQSAGVDVICNTIVDDENGGGNVSGVGVYARGDAVVLLATPYDGYRFIGWYEDDVLVSVDSVYEFTAKFDCKILQR